MRERILFVLAPIVWMGISFADPIEVQVENRVTVGGRYELGVGSTVTLAGSSALFLGELLNADGSLANYLFLNTEESKVYLASSADVVFQADQLQPVLNQYAQVGGTCTGYAINNLFEQMYRSGYGGNGTLGQTLSTEEGRTGFLVEAINEYYLTLQHRYSIEGVITKIGDPLGFSCHKKVFSDSASAVLYVQENTATGRPVMIAFNIGPDMATGPFPIASFAQPMAVEDNRLWIPRKIGERNSGGHSTLAVAEFSVGGKDEFLMLDSDWSSPRIWDVAAVFNDQTAISEVEFYSCD